MSEPAPPTDAVAAREPAEAYFDGAGDSRFYRAGAGVVGRPYVVVHKGDRARVDVGDGVVFDADVRIVVGGNHRIDWIPTYAVREQFDLEGAYEENPWSHGDVVIGAGVHVGRGVCILSGVAIGASAVVRPYAVVVDDVPAGAVVEGSPARQVPGAQAPPRRPAPSWRTRLAAWIAPSPSIPFSDWPATFPELPPGSLELGHRSGPQPIVHVGGDGHRVRIGRFVSLTLDAEFVLDRGAWPSTGDAVRAAGSSASSAGDIEVGHDVWFGRGVKVLPGVTIGSGAVVAAYAVVTDDVRPYAVVAGNPAREVRRRFTDDQVAALLRIAWWNWPDDVVADRAEHLCSADVDAFIDRYRPEA